MLRFMIHHLLLAMDLLQFLNSVTQLFGMNDELLFLYLEKPMSILQLSEGFLGQAKGQVGMLELGRDELNKKEVLVKI